MKPLRVRARPHYVYGLFVGPKCIYVGMTWHPNKRLTVHRTATSSEHIREQGVYEMQILHRGRNFYETAKKEMEIIQAMRQRGMARCNRVFSGGGYRNGMDELERLKTIRQLRNS